MIKGHIDNVGPESVDGWIYSELLSLTGSTVLAFDGDVCIGSSQVEIDRPDLAAVGFGDGRNGFSIYCSPEALAQAKDINVRLLDSDFMIRASRKNSDMHSGRFVFLNPFTVEEDARLSWMAAQGWLTQSQFALARALNLNGSYIRTFSRNELGLNGPNDVLLSLLKETLSIMYRKDISSDQVVRENFSDIPALRKQLMGLRVEEQFVAFFGASFGCELIDGAHRVGGDLSGTVVTAHKLSSFQVAISHIDCLRSISLVDSERLQVFHF